MVESSIISQEKYPLQNSTSEFVRKIYLEGTADNTIKAYRSDLKYFWAWAKESFSMEETYPVSVPIIIRFITDHLGNLSPSTDQALLAKGFKTKLGKHSINTIYRRISSLSTAHKLKNLSNPCQNEGVKTLLSKSRKASVKKSIIENRPIVEKKQAATGDILEKMIQTCGDSLIDKRDKALLLVGFASGGRRRSEIVSLRIENLTRVKEGFTVRLLQSKTDQIGIGRELPILGKAALALEDWLISGKIYEGFLFRRVDRFNNIGEKLSDKTVARVIKKRAKRAGFNEDKFSGHSLRSGFITECGKKKIPKGEAMHLTGHKTEKVFNEYYQVGDILNNEAARILD